MTASRRTARSSGGTPPSPPTPTHARPAPRPDARRPATGWSRARVSEQPFDHPVGAARDLAAPIHRAELRVTGMQEVLAHEGQLERGRRAPRESRTQLRVFRELLVGDGADV